MSIVAMTLFSAVPLTALICGLSYAMYSYGLYKMAGNTGAKPALLAWLPCLRLYTLGQIADRYNRSIGKGSIYRFAMPGLRLLSLLFTLLTSAALFVTYLTGWGADAIVALLGISGVSFASMVCRVMELICCYKTFCDFEPEYSVLYLILSILGLEWIALFLCRRNVPVGIAGHCHPRQPRYNEE